MAKCLWMTDHHANSFKHLKYSPPYSVKITWKGFPLDFVARL